MKTFFQHQENLITGETELIQISMSEEHANALAKAGVQFAEPMQKKARMVAEANAASAEKSAQDETELRAWLKSSKAPAAVYSRLGVSA